MLILFGLKLMFSGCMVMMVYWVLVLLKFRNLFYFVFVMDCVNEVLVVRVLMKLVEIFRFWV